MPDSTTPAVPQLGQRPVRRRLGDARGQIQQYVRGEALTDGVQRGGPHAVVGRDTDHIDLGDPAVTQPLGKTRPVLVLPLEAAVRGGVRTLVEDGVDRPGGDRGGEIGVEAHPFRADTVPGPGVLEVRRLREVVTRVDVVVTGGHHMPVARLARTDQVGDGGGDIGAPGHREAPALTEVVLDVHDDQGAVHGGCPSVGERGSGGYGGGIEPRESDLG